MIDFVSTTPYRNPYNPWPKFNTVRVQLTNSSFGTTYNDVLTAYMFDPFDRPGPTPAYISYTNTLSSIRIGLEESTNTRRWTIDGPLFLARINTSSLDLPFTELGTGTIKGWSSLAYASPTNSIYVGMSGLSTGWDNYLPWEKRRLRNLEIK